MYKSGWNELSETFRWVALRFSNVSDYSFEVLVADVCGDMAYAIGYERFMGSIAGRPVEPVTVRSTHIYRREEGEWKIVRRQFAPRSTSEGGTQMVEQERRAFVSGSEDGKALDAPVR